MAKFNFRLQGYLNIKEKLEEQRRLEYAKALAILEEETRKRDALIAHRDDKIREFSELARVSIKPHLFAHYNVYIEVVKKRLEEQQKRVDEAAAEAERRRLILVEAMKEKKMLQTLREKDYELFVAEEKRLEQKTVDTVVSYKHAVGRGMPLPAESEVAGGGS